MINLIYFWRLDEEKWFSIILELLEYSSINNINNFKIHIFWDWKLKSKLLDIDWINYNYYWFKDKNYIYSILKKCEFSLMPSMFLETFWLSALESINYWVPVIGFKKWWLKQFVLDKYSLDIYWWQSRHIKNILHIISRFSLSEWNLDRKNCIEISQQYSLESWIYNFTNLIWPNKKVLLINDYIFKIWWIENYVFDLYSLLPKYWYNIFLFWLKIKISHKYRSFFQLFCFFNIYYWILLIYNVIYRKPDVIRIHSVWRFLWWFVVLISFFFRKTTKIVTHHDFGYIYPYPSKLYDESQLEGCFNIKYYLLYWNNSLIKKILLVLKYIHNRLLGKLFKKFDYQFVPSDFMKDYLNKSYWEVNNVKTFPHFFN